MPTAGIEESPGRGGPETPPARRVSITALLVFGFAALVFVAVTSVLALSLGTAARNTFGLLEDKSRLLLSVVSKRTRQFLEPAEAQAEFVARLIERGDLDPSDRAELEGVLRASLAATPQVLATVWLDPEGWMLAIPRGEDLGSDTLDWRSDPVGSDVMADAAGRAGGGAYWGPPIHSDAAGATIVNLRRPVMDDGRFRGLVASSIAIQELSRFLAGLETEVGQNAFILYGPDQVLAHQSLERVSDGLTVEQPLPTLRDLGDPILASIWRPGFEDRALLAGSGHADRVAGTDYIFLYQQLGGFGAVPWTVGSYFREEDVAHQFRQLIIAGVAGGIALLVAVGFAVLIGRRVTRPVGAMARAAVALRDLDLDHVPRLSRSRLAEIDEAASAFNAMAGALRVVSLYMPRKVVEALIRRGGDGVLPSVEREVTVMFTDIAGFSRRVEVEALGPERTAAFLNHHFDLVAACIEAEGGIVDKFIGDGVMAVFGALEEHPDHARRAVRAAGAIAEGVRRENEGERSPTRIRIGLHSGEVVVGNLGAATRMNFTVVGDSVNLAERLQELGKTVAPDADVVVLSSAATAEAAGDAVPWSPMGSHAIRGRGAAIEVFRLVA